MAKKLDFSQELVQLKNYILSQSNEDAKRKWAYPLFAKLFGEKFKTESDAQGADGYVEGRLLIELKSKHQDWVAGFYQALHYAKKGLTYNSVCVISENFIALWKLQNIPEFAVILAHHAPANQAPNEIGKDLAKRTSKANAQEILATAVFKLDETDIEKAKKDLQLTKEMYNFLQILNNLDSDRISVNLSNFIATIDALKKYFEQPIEAIHAFYTLIGFWDITSTISENEYSDELRLIGYKGKKMSEPISIIQKYRKEFVKFIENRYLFTNEGSGLTVDYYFSRFDEVLAQIDPEYVKQHGVFFTDDGLSKMALWFVDEYISENIGENYIAFDPAAGSGNLVANYRGKLKHKIVAELQPDLLRTIERRMKFDPYHVETGFTIIPKTSRYEGLNFLDISAHEYLAEIKAALAEKKVKLDKPLAFLLNPPYKNTDENEQVRQDTEAHYDIHPSILAITGNDAGNERYLAFLAQILNICAEQVKEFPDFKPIMMVFTPTSWLIPRPSFQDFRKVFDKHFSYIDGFMVKSNEFFKLNGKWPVAFTVWQYHFDEKRENEIKMTDLTLLKKNDMAFIDWAVKADVNTACKKIFKNGKKITLKNTRGDIRDLLPEIIKNDKKIKQPRYDFSHAKKKEDYGKLVSGFPLKNTKNHFELNRKCGDIRGNFIGFTDNNTPIRLAQDTCERMSIAPDRVWFMLMSAFSSVNLSQIQSGAANSRSYCAYDLESAKVLFSWFGISKAVNGRYPLWANQFDIWQAKIPKKSEKSYFALCFAFGLAQNSCLVTKFEAHNPVENTPEIFVDNPLCPTNSDSFWASTLAQEVENSACDLAQKLVWAVKEFYLFWNFNYCKGEFMYHIGLQDEPYFKFFDYPDFLTPFSGLGQIRKYAEINGENTLLEKMNVINVLSKEVSDEIFSLLEENGYFA